MIETIIGYLILGVIAMMFIALAEKFYNRLNLYRQKYGFDRTLEAKDIKVKSAEKMNEILDKRFKNFEKETKK